MRRLIRPDSTSANSQKSYFMRTPCSGALVRDAGIVGLQGENQKTHNLAYR
jgi:hypothetical protein